MSSKEPLNIDLLNAEYYNHSGNAFDRVPAEKLLTSLLTKYEVGGNVLEIGSGPGALALWLKKQGCHVTCVEPSSAFAEKVALRGFTVHRMTIQKFEMDLMYDHILAISSLIHVPKEDLPLQIKKIASGLKEEGKFFVTFIEGESAGLEDPTNMGKLRYFSRLKEEEIDFFLSPYFKLLESHKIYNEKMDRFFFLRVYSLYT